MRYKVGYSTIAILILVLLSVGSCGGKGSVNLVLNQAPNKCATIDQSNATVTCEGGVISFSGVVITPDPCHYLTAGLEVMNRSNVVIGINAESVLPDQDAYCVECIGEMSFDGTVSPVGSCSRRVSVVYNGATIAEYEGQ